MALPMGAPLLPYDRDSVDHVLTTTRSVRRRRALDDKIAEARGKPEIFENFKKSIARRARGFEAPYACIESIENAVNLPFDEGLEKERDIFRRCVASTQSQALRHAFFAEREATKIPDVPKDTPVSKIETAGVIGAGTMGGGIAMNFRQRRHPGHRPGEPSRRRWTEGPRHHRRRTTPAPSPGAGSPRTQMDRAHGAALPAHRSMPIWPAPTS